MQHRLGDNENWMRSNKCLTGDPQGMTECKEEEIFDVPITKDFRNCGRQ